MRVALYIAEGREQIVLTPETDLERTLLGKLESKDRIMSIRRGSFYECRGGWTRRGTDDESTMIVLDPVATDAFCDTAIPFARAEQA